MPFALGKGVGVPAPAAIFGANLKRYYEATALTANDNDLIASWVDSAGSGDPATASSGERPTYKAAIDGKPAVLFNGTANVLNHAYTTTPQMWWALVLPNSATTSDRVLAARDSQYFHSARLGSASDFGPNANHIHSTTSAVPSKRDIGQYAGSYGWLLMISTYDPTTKVAKLYVGDNLIDTKTGVGTHTSGSHTPTIGGYWTGSAYAGFFSGYIREMGFCDAVATDDQRTALRRFIANKYFSPLGTRAYSMAAFCQPSYASYVHPGGFLQSDDGITFTQASPAYIPPQGKFGVRDPSIIKYAGKWIMSYTSADPGGTALSKSTKLGLAVSDDGVFFRWYAAIDMTAQYGNNSTSRCWRGAWFIDFNGDAYMLVGGSPDAAATFQSYLVPMTLDGGGYLATPGTPVQIAGPDVPAKLIDSAIWKTLDGKYRIAYPADPGATSVMTIMESASLATGYAQVSSFSGWGRREGPSPIRLANGTLRLFVDKRPATDGMEYRDSTDEGNTFGSAQALTGPYNIGNPGVWLG